MNKIYVILCEKTYEENNEHIAWLEGYFTERDNARREMLRLFELEKDDLDNATTDIDEWHGLDGAVLSVNNDETYYEWTVYELNNKERE